MTAMNKQLKFMNYSDKNFNKKINKLYIQIYVFLEWLFEYPQEPVSLPP